MSNSLDILITKDEQFKEKYPEIMKQIEKKKLLEMEPSLTEINTIYDIIIQFIKEKRRKIYGGVALNKLLIAKEPKFAIYEETDTPDIEFYSPEPINDLVELCDKIAGAGFKPIIGEEAQHKETYKIYVNFHQYCDITYMPSNIYNKARYLQTDGFNIIHPWFIMIDFFRMFSDPLLSYWRLEKHFSRYLKLQKTYPLPLINKPLVLEKYDNKNINKLINIFQDYMSTKDTCILTGFYAYNYYLNYSEYNKYNRQQNYIYMPYLEVYSSNYIKDSLDLIKYIKDDIFQEYHHKITYTEFYPFFQFYGYNVVFYFKDDDIEIPILYLYSNNNKCIPFKEVPYIQFDNTAEKSYNIPKPVNKKNILIGAFDFNILQALIILVKVRVDDDNEWNDTLYTLINGYVKFRKYYLEKNNKTIYDDTIFQGFVINCIGVTIPPEKERKLLIQARKKLGKPLVFRYEPGVSKPPSKTYRFANSSGNRVNSANKLKLKEENLNKKLEDEIEGNEEEDDDSNDSEEKSNKSGGKNSKSDEVSNDSEGNDSEGNDSESSKSEDK
jgi:hypothetical protein